MSACDARCGRENVGEEGGEGLSMMSADVSTGVSRGVYKGGDDTDTTISGDFARREADG